MDTVVVDEVGVVVVQPPPSLPKLSIAIGITPPSYRARLSLSAVRAAAPRSTSVRLSQRAPNGVLMVTSMRAWVV